MAFQNEVAPNTTARHQGRLAYLEGTPYLPQTLLGPLWEEATESSLVLRTGRQISIGMGETVVPVNTVRPEVGQVGVGTRPQDREGYEKPVSGVAWDFEAFAPIKLATIVTVSEEFARENPAGLYTEIQSELAQAIGRGIDLAVFHNRRADNGAVLLGTTANSYINATTNRVDYPETAANLRQDMVNAWSMVAANRLNATGWAVDPMFRPEIMGAVDPITGQPMFGGQEFNLAAQQGSLLGLPVQYGSAVSGAVGNYAGTGVKAFVGDWSRLVYGYADRVRVKATDVGNVGSVNLFTTNQIALLVEVTFGWKVDPDAFAALEDTGVPGDNP